MRTITLKDTKSIYGMEIMALSEAISKSKNEEFFLLYQSKLSLEAFGVLKRFRLKDKSGYLFIPILKDGKFVII